MQGPVALHDGAGRLTHGLALVLGPSGVVDIDLDCDAARALAPRFLRSTATFGRKGRTTHYLYRVAPQPHPDNGGPQQQPRRRDFKHEGHGMLLELRRGPGQQTVIPPSLKPDGDPAYWVVSPWESFVSWEPGDEQRVEDLALAVLVALDGHDGARHESRLRWAGELLSRGVEVERARHIVSAGCEHRGDTALADIAAALDSTATRLANGEQVRGVDLDNRKAVDKVLGRVPADGRPQVYVGGDLAAVLDQINQALGGVDADELTIFRAGDTVTALHGSNSPHRWAAELAQHVAFVRKSNEGPVPVQPQGELIKRWASRPDDRVPELLGIWDGPLVRADGTIRLTRGYDEATRRFCEGWSGPEPGTTLTEARAAMTRLLTFVWAGQFEAKADLAAWLAHVLTVAARPAIENNVPAFVYSSSAPGSGKTTLARLAGILGGGCGATTDPNLSKPDELARRLDAHATGAAIVLDNLRGSLRSETLESAITSGILDVRRLYLGPVRVPWRCVLSVTSNGAETGRDWARRVLPVRLGAARLDARKELLKDVTSQLRADAATIVRGWLLSGLDSRATALASFAEWSRVVAGAVAWVCDFDVVASTREAAEGLALEDEDSGLLDELEAWRPGGQSFTVRELLDATTGWPRVEALAEALHVVVGADASAKSIGRRFKRLHDQTRVLRQGERTKHGRQWRIVGR